MLFWIWMLGLGRLMAADPVMVPRSISPDGKTALFYFHDSSKSLNEGYELLFADAASGLPSSGNILPDVPRDTTTPEGLHQWEANALLGLVASKVEASRQQVPWNVGFTYDVAWSPDSQWVSIEGGAHKFWKALIYHYHHGDYREVRLPEAEFVAPAAGAAVPDRGAKAAILKISPRKADYPVVCWLDNGVVAINAYPYLFREDFFFVVDVRKRPAKLTGYCR